MDSEHTEPNDVDVDDRLWALLGRIHGAAFEFDEHGTYLNVWVDDPDRLAAPRKLLLGKTIVEIYGEAVGGLLAERVRRVHATGRAEKYEHSLPIRGRNLWIAADLPRIRRGRRFTVVLLRVDMTERKEALRLSEERYRLAAEATNDMLYDATIGADAKVTFGSTR